MLDACRCACCGKPFKEGDLLQTFLRSPDNPSGSWLKTPVVVDAEFQSRALRNNDKIKRYHSECINQK
jgi:hypothetical protein